MTHEKEPNLDAWEELGDARAFEAQPLEGVPIGDLAPAEVDPVASGTPVPDDID